MNRKNRIYTLLTLVVLAMFVFVPAASAFDGRGGDTIMIGKDEVINDDLYLGGNNIIVDGTVNGDLMAAGETVIVNGKVSGDLFAAGTRVTINGEVGDDVYAAAGAVTIGPNAKITDDVFSVGGSVETRAGSQVGGSLLLGAGQGLLSGQITEDLLAGSNRLRLEGTVDGNAKITVGDSSRDFPYYYGPNTPPMPTVQSGLTFGPDAHVAGSLDYTSAKEVNISMNVSPKIQHFLPPMDEELAREVAQRQTTSSLLFNNLRRMVALLLIGLLLARLAPRWITVPAETVKSRLLPSLGVGLLSLITAPMILFIALGVLIVIAVIFGLLSLGRLTGLTLAAGLPSLTLVSVAFVVVTSYLCQAIVAYLGGRWVLGRFAPTANEKIYWPLLLGLVILALVFMVPVLGDLLQILTILAGLGAIVLQVWQSRQAPAQPVLEIPAPIQA